MSTSRVSLCVLAVVAGAMACSAAASAAEPAPSATEEARRHYLKAQQAYDLGRWDEAIAGYEAAYSFRNDPSFLYNMAQAYRRKGDARRALDLYKNYLVKVPDASQRSEIEDRIRVLRKQIAKEGGRKSLPGAAAPALVVPVPVATPVPAPAVPSPGAPGPAGGSATPAAPEPASGAAAAHDATAPAASTRGTAPADAVTTTVTASDPADGRGLRIAGLATAAGGVLMVAGGAYMGLRAKSLSDEVSSDASKLGTYQKSKYDGGTRAETLQWVGYGVGAAALAGGAVLYWLGLRRPEAEPQSQPSVTALPMLGSGHTGGSILVQY